MPYGGGKCHKLKTTISFYCREEKTKRRKEDNSSPKPSLFFFLSSGSPIREEGRGKRGISESLCRTSVAAAVINTDEQVFRGAEFL